MTHPIRKLALALILTSLAAPASAAQVWIQMSLPAVLPPLVVVQPGVQVVGDFDREIFFVGGYYWARRDGSWYRARDPHARWYYAHPSRVPAFLVQAPPGHYRHWRGHGWKAGPRQWRTEARREHGHGRGHD